MKKYKHKRKGRFMEVTKPRRSYQVDLYSDKTKQTVIGSVPGDLPENSSDREEVKENVVAYNGMYIGEPGFNNPRLYVTSYNFSFFEGSEGYRNSFSSKIRAMKALRKWSAENDAGFEPDWSDFQQKKYCLAYRHDDKERDYNNAECYQEGYFLPFFSGPAVVQKCIKEISDVLDDLLD